MMKNKIDGFGYIFTASVVLFCALGFYWIFSYSEETMAAKIGFSACWLVFSFIWIVYSVGISRGDAKTAIKVPLKPAISIFSMAAIMLMIAVLLEIGK